MQEFFCSLHQNLFSSLPMNLSKVDSYNYSFTQKYLNFVFIFRELVDYCSEVLNQKKSKFVLSAGAQFLSPSQESITIE